MRKRKLIEKSADQLDSSKILTRYGAQQKITNGNITYSGSLGIERQIDLSSRMLSGGESVSGSYKNNDYELAYSYFEKHTGSRILANTMAAVILDASSMSDYAVVDVIEVLSNNTEIISKIHKRAVDSMNKIRSPADQHMLVRDTTNNNKLASRLISP